MKTANEIIEQVSLDVAYLIEAKLSQAEIKSVLTAAGEIAKPFNTGPEDAKTVTFADDVIDELVGSVDEVEEPTPAERKQVEEELHELLLKMSQESPDMENFVNDIQKVYATDNFSDVILSLALIKAIEYAEESGGVDDDGMRELVIKAHQALLNFRKPVKSVDTKSTDESIDLSDITEDVLTEAVPVLSYLTRIPGMLKTISDLDKGRRSVGKDERNTANKMGDYVSNKYKGMPSTQIRSVKHGVKGDISTVDFSSLADAWELDGNSLESEDIIRILKNNGFSNKQVRKAFDNAGVSLHGKKRDDRIVRLSRIIYKHGLQELVLRYLKTSYGINESIIREAALTDKTIKQIFVDVLKQQDNEEKNMSSNKLMDRVEDWAREIKRADTTNEKTILAKEIVNVMANRKHHPDHKSMIAAVEKIIRSSKIDPKFMNRALQNLRMGTVMEHTDYLTASYLLCECDLSWDSLSLKPMILEDNSVRLDYVLAGTTVLLEDIFTDALRYQFIHKQLER